MDNNVVFACCSGLRSNSIAYLRFNFQGVGQSQGTTGDLGHHVADILSASAYLKSISGLDPDAIGVVGYSFGGSATIKALLNGLTPAAAALIACSFPELTPADNGKLNLPKLVILGENDSFIDPQSVSVICNTLAGKTDIKLIQGADHFFMGGEKAISTMIGDFFSTTFSLKTKQRPLDA